MPVIIQPADYGAWLTGDADQAQCLLVPWAGDELRMWAVSAGMNKVGAMDGPECLAAAVESQGRLL